MDPTQRYKKGRSELCALLPGSITDDDQEDGSRCSIFSFDVNANRSRLPLAKNALRKFRTLRHPGIVKVLDTVEVG